MPIQVTGFDCYEVEFDKNGAVYQRTQAQTLLDGLKKTQPTDLIVWSHGWNNGMQEARDRYKTWLENAKRLIDAGSVALPGRKLAFLGILWPSKKFADDDDKPAGGAASFGSAGEGEQLQKRIRDLADAFPPDKHATIEDLALLVPEIDKAKEKRDLFVKKLRTLLSNGQDDGGGDTTKAFFDLPPNEVLERLAPEEDDDAPVAPQGGAVGLRDFFSGAIEAAHNALNLATYYEMKARAGLVGAKGLNSVLREVRAANPDLRLHLVGHSFGGRVVAAAADGPDHASDLKFASMTLLQAAFSHHSFASPSGNRPLGFFRAVVDGKRVQGPILITHTKSDKPVGITYPLASRLARQNASGIGGRSDPYGGIGSNGAVQDANEVVELDLLAVGMPYAFHCGKINNLNADKFIKGHGDVTGKEVVYATLMAIAAT